MIISTRTSDAILRKAFGRKSASIIGFDKMHSSVDVFNQECSLTANRTQSFWSLNANQYGFGFAYNF